MSAPSFDNVAVVILAAGQGTRMKSDLPKAMHTIGKKPIVEYIVETLEVLGFSSTQIMMVVGYGKDVVKAHFGDRVSYAVQEEQKGTAHAANIGMQALPDSIKMVLVIGGDDSAFYHGDTIASFISAHTDGPYTLSLLSAEVEDSTQYGRIVRHEDGRIEVIEKEYVTDFQKAIKEVSTGTFCFDRAWFENMFPNMPELKKLGEYGLPTTMAMAIEENVPFQVITMNDSSEWFGINTPEELVEANRKKQTTS